MKIRMRPGGFSISATGYRHWLLLSTAELGSPRLSRTTFSEKTYGLGSTVRPRYLVVLRPSVAAVLERDHARQRALGKVAYRSGEINVQQLDALLGATPRIGLWLDTSTLTSVETVQSILDRRTEAGVDSVI
jgi:hypothetical protein